MTTVTMAPLAEGYLFECSGHAGSGDGGCDEVCAGASALCMALEAMAEGMTDEGCARVERKYASDGYFSLEIAPESGDDFAEERLRTVMETVMAGFAAIEEEYPEFLRVES